MLRVKNESRFLSRALSSILPICESVHVFDDHSTDSTPDIIRDMGCAYYPSPYPSSPPDEARDRSYLLREMGRAVDLVINPCSNTWVLSIDGDEELVEFDRGKLTGMQPDKDVSFAVQILYLWDRPDCVRVDGHYAMCLRPSFFRFMSPCMSYRNCSGPLHTTGVPWDVGATKRVHSPSPVRLLHYGYMDAADRQRKYDFYTGIDPVQKEFYSRECFGPVEIKLLPEILSDGS